jgi:hypothetical protein
MSDEKELHATEANFDACRGISRREAARRLLAAIGTGAVLPWSVSGHPVWKHLKDEALMDRAGALAADARLHFLEVQQFESLSSLAELIVPGSGDAKVAGFIDLLLSAEKAKHQKEFLNSLAAFDAESSKKYGKKFTAISRAEQNEVLVHASTLQKSDQSEAPLREGFENLREWISGAYYSSEKGMRELGWTPNRVFAEFPSCPHGAGHG